MRYDMVGAIVAIGEASNGSDLGATVAALLADHGAASVPALAFDTMPHCSVCGAAIPFGEDDPPAAALWIEGQLLVDLVLGRVTRLQAETVHAA